MSLEARGVGLDVSRLPLCAKGALAQRLGLEAELVRQGAIPAALDQGDPLRLYWNELEAMPRLDEAGACRGLERGDNPNDLTVGLLWLILQEAPAFAGQGVLLLDLMQEGAMGLMGAVEYGAEPVVENARWHVRQAMARAVALQYLVSGEAERLVASVRAYQKADRRLLERLGRNPGLEEVAQEMGKTLLEVQQIAKIVRDAAAAAKREPETEEALEKVEDSTYFQLRTQVEELLSRLEPMDQALLRLRFGLDGKEPKSQEDTARILKITLSQERQREAEAMLLLRQ